MTTPDEDEAWRLIVDNYGETARRESDPPDSSAPGDEHEDQPGDERGDQRGDERGDQRGDASADAPRTEPREIDDRPLEPPQEDPAGGPVPDWPQSDPLPAPGPFLGGPAYEPPPPPSRREPDEEERFVPPPPPLAPPMPWQRRAAWAGVLAAPLVFMLAAMTGLSLPRWALTVLLVGLVTGFGYLVLTMPKDPPDPWDDGSRV